MSAKYAKFLLLIKTNRPIVINCTFDHNKYSPLLENGARAPYYLNHFYTTPSMIQKLMSLDDEIPTSFDLSSLRIIGSG